MKSIVEHYTPTDKIQVPDHYFEIELPSWEIVIQPVLDQVAAQFAKPGSDKPDLTDDMIMTLGISGVETIEQFKLYAKDYIEEEQVQLKFYHDLMPFLLAFHGETADVIINSEEETRYRKEYLEQVSAYAEEYDLSLEDYARQQLGIAGDVNEELAQRAKEDYIFKIIAHDRVKEKNIELDELTYERFIQQNVLQNGADEIEVREQFPYEVFKKIMPEMSYSQSLFEYFKSKFHFKING